MTEDAAGLAALLATQRAAFARGAPDYDRRIAALDALRDGIRAHQQALVDAVSEDFGGRAAEETLLLELFPLLEEIRNARRQLRRWMRPRAAAEVLGHRIHERVLMLAHGVAQRVQRGDAALVVGRAAGEGRALQLEQRRELRRGVSHSERAGRSSRTRRRSAGSPARTPRSGRGSRPGWPAGRAVRSR